MAVIQSTDNSKMSILKVEFLFWGLGFLGSGSVVWDDLFSKWLFSKFH